MNELVIINKISQELEKPRKEVVFPLTPTHRRELRQLRDRNIGDLRNRMNTIRNLKKEEYKKKYTKEIIKESTAKKIACDKLNNDWKVRIEKIVKIIKERQALEDKQDLNWLDMGRGYSDICGLNIDALKKIHRTYSMNDKKIAASIAENEFKEKFDKPFQLVKKKIDNIYMQYEEAINFGDLEIVKRLYYIMKKSDKLFERIEEMEV